MEIRGSKEKGQVPFERIPRGEGFYHGGKLYIKFNRFIHLVEAQNMGGGSTRDVGGYNALCLANGQPGSFRDHTTVRPRDLVVVDESDNCCGTGIDDE